MFRFCHSEIQTRRCPFGRKDCGISPWEQSWVTEFPHSGRHKIQKAGPQLLFVIAKLHSSSEISIYLKS